MTHTLNNKPLIGIISGFMSGFLYWLKGLVTDDITLKILSGIGIWAGVLVALLTVWLRIQEIKKNNRKA